MLRRSLRAARSSARGLWLSSVNEGPQSFSMLRDLPQQVRLFWHPARSARARDNPLLWRRGEQRWNWIACTASLAAVFGVGLGGAWRCRRQRVGCRARSRRAAANAAALENQPSYFGIPPASRSSSCCFSTPLRWCCSAAGAAHAVMATDVAAPQIVESGDPALASARPTTRRSPRCRVGACLPSSMPDHSFCWKQNTPCWPRLSPQSSRTSPCSTFPGAPDDAKARMTTRGIDYVAFCPALRSAIIMSRRRQTALWLH